MGYTLVIIKIRFENLTRILHFPNLMTSLEVLGVEMEAPVQMKNKIKI
jgi:hypothetical protein